MLYNSNDIREMIKNDLNFKTLTLERKSQLNEAIEKLAEHLCPNT